MLLNCAHYSTAFTRVLTRMIKMSKNESFRESTALYVLPSSPVVNTVSKPVDWCVARALNTNTLPLLYVLGE